MVRKIGLSISRGEQRSSSISERKISWNTYLESGNTF
jgi:hypothetical protein